MDFGTWFALLMPMTCILVGYYLMYSGREVRLGALFVFGGFGLYVVAAAARWGLWGLFVSLGILASMAFGGYLVERLGPPKRPQ